MKTAYRSDVGRIRPVNEDRAVVLPDVNGYTLAVVADGMGGHQAGETASQMAIESIQEELRKLERGNSPSQWEAAILQAIEHANENIYRLAFERQEFHGMGTTVVAAVANKDTLVVGHIGDSRAYLISGESISQLTEDHSLVNELVRNGQITADEAHNHPRRNVLTRALGTDFRVQADISSLTWKPGDILLLCSDGLSGLVKRDIILEILGASEDLDRKANRLVEQALEAGGDDNVTVVLIENAPVCPEEKG